MKTPEKKKISKESKEKGELGFSKTYWEKNYDEPSEMDGIVNSQQHAHYIKSFFDVEYIDINSVIDFGFGLGFLLEKVVHEFQPYRVWGIEPSPYAFEKVSERELKFAPTTKVTLKQWGLSRWCDEMEGASTKKSGEPKKRKWFDLGLCTSVFQYLSEEEISKALPLMAQMTKYLYLSVPTDYELERQVSEHDFLDEYALRRPKEFYLDLLAPHFTIIGSRMLESKVHFNEDNTFFTDYLFRI